TGGNGGIGVSAGGSGHTYGRGRCVLFVVGVQDEQYVQGLGSHGVDFIAFSWYCEQHAQQIGRVVQVILWTDFGLAAGVFVGTGRKGGHDGEHATCEDLAERGVVYGGGVVIKGGQGADEGGEQGQRMGFVTKAFDEFNEWRV